MNLIVHKDLMDSSDVTLMKEAIMSTLILDRLAYISVVIYLVYILIEGWKRLIFIS